MSGKNRVTESGILIAEWDDQSPLAPSDREEAAPAQWLRDFAEHTDSGVANISSGMCTDIAAVVREVDSLRAALSLATEARQSAERDSARLREMLRASTSPGHTDLMVPPESIDAYLDATTEDRAVHE